MVDTTHLESIEPSFLLQRLIEQYQKQDRLIIAYDFDDTVSPYVCSNCTEVQSVLRMSKENLNAYFIVYTCNSNHQKIKDFLDYNRLPYDCINAPAPFSPLTPAAIGEKLYYNILLDDKAGLGEATAALKTLNRLVYQGVIKKNV